MSCYMSNFSGMSRSLTAALRRGLQQVGPSCASSASARACASAMMDASARQASRTLSAGHPVLQSWRQQANLSGASLGFAASPIVVGCPPTPALSSPVVSSVQARGASTTSLSDEADEEATSSTSGLRPRRGGSLSKEGGDDDDDPLPVGRFARGKMRRRQGDGPGARREAQDPDPLEFKLLSEELFIKKPLEAVAIPPNIREVLYRFTWDKVLVDVRSATFSTDRGKSQVYTAMVAVGNLNGLFGLGLADAPHAVDAVGKAYTDAFSKLMYVPLFRGHTIYHRIDHEFHHMKMRLMPRADGWGVKASNLVSELCGLVGIKNISIKTFGRVSNKLYVAQCFQEALSMQSTPHDGVEGTGVYVREVFDSRRGNGLPMNLRRGVDVL